MMIHAGPRRSAHRLVAVVWVASSIWAASRAGIARAASAAGAWPLPPTASTPAAPTPAAPTEAVHAEGGPATITVTPEVSRFELGTALTIPVRVVLSGDGARQAQIGKAAANVGSIDIPAGRRGTTTYLAHYTVPEERFPQVALIVVQAVFPGGRRVSGSSVIWLTARTEIPFRTTAHASVTLEIAGVLFGPRVADNDGRVRVPVVVPPGVAQGMARATDRFGGMTETTVNLQPKDYPRTVVMAPSEGEAGSIIDVAVWGVSPTGGPAPPEDLQLQSSAGQVTRKSGESGRAVFAVKLHAKVSAGAVAIKGRIAASEAEQPDTITVHAGQPAAIEIVSDRAELVIGSQESATVSVRAVDRFGNPSGAGRLQVTVDRQPAPIATATGSTVTISVSAPGEWKGRKHREVEAVLHSAPGPLRAKHLIPIVGGPAAHLAVVALQQRVTGDGTSAAILQASVTDADGVPTRVRRLVWEAGEGTLEPVGSPHPGIYVARFVPNRTRRDATVAIRAASADDQLTATTQIAVDSSAKHWVAVHAGLAWNLGALFGPALLIDATRSMVRLGEGGRELAAGVALGYLPSRFTASASDSALAGSAATVEVDRFPFLAVARLKIPLASAAQLAVAALGGVSHASYRVAAAEIMSRSTALGFAVGASAEAALPIGDGALIVGVRYLALALRSRADADRVEGNAGGVMLDVGYGGAF